MDCAAPRHTHAAYAVCPPSRQARELAEGQKRTKVKHFFILPPPSARQCELAEGVEFLEKNVVSWLFRLPIGGGGR
jgi:hypothetical protein